MELETYIYMALLVITAGLAAFSIMIAFNLFKRLGKTYFQTLLFQQIFFYSYFLYGVWGDIAIHQGLNQLGLEPITYQKISFYIPILGLPFLVVSWYMLIKFLYQVKGYQLKWYSSLNFFAFVIGFLSVGAFVIHSRAGHGDLPILSEEAIKKLIIILNLITNLFVLAPLLKKFKANDLKSKSRVITLLFSGYLAGVVLYSVGLWFISTTHFSIAIASILFICITYTALPLTIWQIVSSSGIYKNTKVDFAAFCQKFDISKREAEIIHEICLGKSNKDIAEALFITLQTVKDHTHRIYTKTGVKNRVHLTNLVREIVG